jgi:predicted nucleic-acid-binding protein
MKNMEITDANIILRYLLKDDENCFSKARVILEENNILLPFEVCAEVIYVLEKVYKVPRKNIHDALIILINYPNIAMPDKSLLLESLKIYEAENIDFIDSLLVAYHIVLKAKIHTFDKKLLKLCI